MRISIDATGLGSSKTGTSVYLVEILSRWSRNNSINHEFTIFASEKAVLLCSEAGLDHRFRFVRAPNNRHIRVIWQQLVMPWHIRRLKIDVHWGTAFVLPVASQRPMAVTIHDLTFQLFPEVHQRLKRFYFPAIMQRSVEKAQAVFVVSRTTETDLERIIPKSKGKTTVTPLAARELGPATPAPRDQCTSGDYLLFVGTLEPRKNLSRLLSAWQMLDDATRGSTRLVVVGATGWMVSELVQSLKTNSTIDVLGQVSDSALAELMQGTKALVYPSLYEGFGLPVVEAMARGIPVLTGDTGATGEIAEGAAILVDPTNVDAIHDGLVRLLTEPELLSFLSLQGRERAKSFSWERTAQVTLETLEVLKRA
ncbi:glycosyltransferase family 4 protein [Rhizobium sp. Pop5]|uniref:glycosyltransferase family 4 protein n=1 Tax=Rhizobium sp. Pop5 TaxID=1223565 RepID=UPI000283D414|nr:glycosyltransferase family 1 protein [Rhizobium sp. Pop5]EJZ20319.1 group 1 glycosyl transferase [Rhizobium sp. Pop5]UVD57483.1 glycosyltransferase family 4 protein [Rhizobium sp. Pop5]